MHELALSQGVVELVAQRAAREGLRQLTRVVRRTGDAAVVEPQALCAVSCPYPVSAGGPSRSRRTKLRGWQPALTG